MSTRPKVLLGMSGGVDSSLSASLLLEAGYDVVGAFMKNWSGTVEGPQTYGAEHAGEPHQECGWRTERRDAMRVAAQLGIPFLTFDFEEAYRRDVVDVMFREYAAGRTPNPDILCNRYVKFDLFVKEADKLGIHYIATGHYAQARDGKLLRAKDDEKDQTYFLWAIDPGVVARVIFPLGGMTKSEVREEARTRGLHVADKKDSTGICFVGEVDMTEFLRARIPEAPGPIVHADGRVLGEHRGLSFYTIGQRSGVGVASTEPLYVVEKQLGSNTLVLGPESTPALWSTTLSATDANWFRMPITGDQVQVRVRHRGALEKATVTDVGEKTFSITFAQPVRAIASGQSAVVYNSEEVLGGGIIT